MFSQKKKRSNIGIYIMLIFFLVLACALIFLPDRSESPDVRTVIENQGQDSQDADGETEGNQTEDTQKDPEQREEIEKQESYYMVRNDNNSIKVYFCDSKGTITELETTAIIYETLSDEDQRMFDMGVKISSRDELFKLLQDFES